MILDIKIFVRTKYTFFFEKTENQNIWTLVYSASRLFLLLYGIYYNFRATFCWFYDIKILHFYVRAFIFLGVVIINIQTVLLTVITVMFGRY